MKKIFTTLAAGLIGISAFAQIPTAYKMDSVKMEAGRINDVYYHSTNGEVKKENNKNWFIALGTKSQTAGVFINSANDVVCFNPHKSVADWASITLADTSTATKQFNSETSWSKGALNQGAPAGSQFDFGFGKYNQTAHRVEGDSIFIIRQGANYYKLRIDSVYGTNNYAISVGGVGSPIPTLSFNYLKNPNYSNSNFIYVNATTMGLVDVQREPANNDWDIVFTEYSANINNIQYLVVGGLLNGTATGCRVQATSASTAAANFATYTYSPIINTIGYDWKVFNGTGYVYDSLNSYLINSMDGNTYQYNFTGYRKSDGYVAFSKRRVNTNAVAISEINKSATSIAIVPNPSNADVTLALESKLATQGFVQIIDMQGRTIYSTGVQIHEGINGFTLPTKNIAAGLYTVRIAGKGILANSSFLKN
jgi:hypothetical protein